MALWRVDRRPEPAVSLFSQLIESKDEALFQTAMRGLRDIGPQAAAAAPALMCVLRKKEKTLTGAGAYSQKMRLKQVRFFASSALAKIGPAAVPDLIEALADEDIEVRRLAAQALATIGPDAKAVLPHLTRLIENEDPRLRLEGARCLWRIAQNHELAVPVLIDLVKEGKYPTNVYAAHELGEVGAHAEPAIPILIDVVKGTVRSTPVVVFNRMRLGLWAKSENGRRPWCRY